MNIIPLLIKELENEFQITKHFVARFPENHTDYKPHEKSMDITVLANHVVEIFAWPAMMIELDKIDLEAGDYKPTAFKTIHELEHKLETDFATGKNILTQTDESILLNRWKLTAGEMVFADDTKYEAIRHALNQITHHRAQLGVYYRLLNIEVPSSYGPSADTQVF